jgi:hypothetical protein
MNRESCTGGVVLLVAGVAGLGFYRGWFSLASDRSDAKSNVTPGGGITPWNTGMVASTLSPHFF